MHTCEDVCKVFVRMCVKCLRMCVKCEDVK